MSGNLLVSRDTAVATMDKVSTFMEHSFQSGKTNNKLVNRYKTRQDHVIESDGGGGGGSIRQGFREGIS